MKKKITSICITAMLSAVSVSSLQAQIITTVAGGVNIDGGPATAAAFYAPNDIAVDSAGNVYIGDDYNRRIRKINTSGIISTIGGTGENGNSGDGGPATSATISDVVGVAVDGSGNVYFADYTNNNIRKITTSGIMVGIAGTGTSGFSGDGGAATAAEISTPGGIIVDKAGNIYFADQGNQRIRKINTSGIISTIAGNGTAGYSGDGGPATAAEVNYPFGVAVDTAGNIYMADQNNNVVRKVNTSGIISTIAGNSTAGYSGDGGAATAAEFNIPDEVKVDNSGNIYIADLNNNCIRVVNASGIVNTIAGNGTAGYIGDGGMATAAELNSPWSVAINNSGVYIDDAFNNRIRKVNTSGIINTIGGNGTAAYLGDGVAATAAELGKPASVVTDGSGNIYIADMANNRIRKVNTAGIISTIAGNGTQGYSGDGGPATAAEMFAPFYIKLDNAGNIYFSDDGNNCVRKINTSGVISTLAGNGTAAYSGDGGPATAAELNSPNGIIADASGNIYIADASNERVRKINTSGIITTIAGNGTAGFSGDGGPATSAELNNPYGLALDDAGSLYVVDQNNNCIRKIDAAGTISTIAGNGTSGYSGDGGPATAAELSYPTDIVLDAAGDIVFSDEDNEVIRKISTTGIISTIAGNDTLGCSGDGGPAVDAEMYLPYGIEIDNSGNLYIADTWNDRIRKVTGALGVPTVSNASDMFRVYPNPTTGDFNVTILGAGNEVSIKLMDMYGREIEAKDGSLSNTDHTTTFDAQGLPAGIYMVIATVDGKVYNQKLVVAGQ